MQQTASPSVAIIGSGMAGLSAARLLKDAGFDVTIYEALPGRGMDSHSLHMDGGIIDAPLRVMNPSVWPNTLALAAYMDVPVFKVRTFMSCNWLEQDQRLNNWFKSRRTSLGNLPTLASLRYINQTSLSVLKGFFQFRQALKQFKHSPHQEMSLADFHMQHAIEPLFWYGILLPVINTICTCEPQHIGKWPAKPILDFVNKLMQGEALLRLQGGTSALVNALIQDIPVISGAKVTTVEYQQQQALVRNERGQQGLYDYVIVATPTTHLGFLNAAQFRQELQLLQQFKFDQGRLVIHRDKRFMPCQKADWTVLNYSMDTVFSQQMFTVWMNAIEPTLANKTDMFQTWNPVFEPDASQVISSVWLSRAIVDSHTAALIQQVKHLQQNPERRVFFCGSWLCDGLPILESAVTSAMWVVKQLGVHPDFAGQKPRMVKAAGLPR
ncbi:FAD-dependent oxidoreductase [Alkanindiges sp. WGS2144]|uniref:FAD-dependent oxidoreductase n=1 Tax=Alkanindiges sp. WGS2144 TaxID=3366808 RepID=UPI0037522E26